MKFFLISNFVEMFFGQQAWRSVEYNCVKDWSVTPSLKLKYYLVNFVIKVGRVGQEGHQLVEKESPYCGLFVVVLDVDVDDVNSLTSTFATQTYSGIVVRSFSTCANSLNTTILSSTTKREVVQNLIVDPFLGSEYDVILSFCCLKALRTPFDPPISVQHVQYTILSVH